MASEVSEIKESRETRTESGGRKTTTRVFHINVPQDIALDQTGIPQDDEALPWDSSQTAFSRVASYQTGSVNYSRVVVTYSNDPPTWGGGNPGDITFKGWNISYYRISQAIPYAIRDPRGYRWTDATGASQAITTYPVQYTNHLEARKRFIRHVRISNLTAAQWEPIGNLSNSLMKINNRWYLFTLGDLQEVARNVWDTSYTFEYDPGTPSGVFPIDDDYDFPDGLAAVRPPGGFGTATFWTRPPYHEVRLIPGYFNNAPTWPVWRAICAYTVNQNGWQLLPAFGNP